MKPMPMPSMWCAPVRPCEALEQLQEGSDLAALEARPVADVAAATLRDLRLLVLRRPEQCLGLGVPAQVHLVQPLVMGQEDDLGRELRLGSVADRVVHLLKQPLVCLEPAVADDHGR